MEKYQSPTVDRLVLQVVEEIERRRQSLGTFHTSKHAELEAIEREQILDAKRATTAFFLEREVNAHKTGLQGYRDFLNILFDGDRNPRVLESTARRVLSFNYDRLFEIAFADYFKLDPSVDCYGQRWLNSSLDFIRRRGVDLDPARFCFLKLHGTAGIFVAEQHGESRYGCVPLHCSDCRIDDKLFWPPNRKAPPLQRESAEPLIVFPFEKDRARLGGTSFCFDNYVRAIWGEPEGQGYAEKLVQESQQIRVIGYSFDPNDRKAIINLLRKSADSPIIIRNRAMEAAQSICDELGLDYPDLANRLRAFARPF